MLRFCAALLAFVLCVHPAVAQKQPITAPSPDGKRTAKALNKVINITDNQTDKLLISLRAHNTDITGLVYAPDGKVLGSVDKDGVANLSDPATGKILLTIKTGLAATGLSYAPDGKTVEVKAGKVSKKYDVDTGKEKK
jgi:WD40 repeat protein